VSRPREEPDSPSEDQIAPSRREDGALAPIFVSLDETLEADASCFLSEDLAPEANAVESEGDDESIFPSEGALANPHAPAATEPGLLIAGDTTPKAKSFASVGAYLWPLAMAAMAVMAVEIVTKWRVPTVAAPTKSATVAANEPASAAATSATSTVGSASTGVAPATQANRRADADRAASLRTAPTERPIATALAPQPKAALNTRLAPIAVDPLGAPAFSGIAAKPPSIEMLATELPAAVVETAAAPPIAPEEVDVEAEDKAAIDRVLDTYQQSYSALDAAMVSTIWLGLDTRGLQRAFDGLDSQRMSFEHCDVTIDDDKARVSCTGVLNYVRKIGQTTPLNKRLSWNFDLQRTDNARWLISKVDAR